MSSVPTGLRAILFPSPPMAFALTEGHMVSRKQTYLAHCIEVISVNFGLALKPEI